MLLKIIVYAYLNNVYSGRQMEKLLVENISYMWLSGMQTPDFRTINIFRSKRLANKFDDIFTQIVLLLHDEGLVSLKVQYIDGTKIESVANKYTFVWKGSTEKNKAKLEANVRSVLEAADMGCKVLKCALTPATAASRTMHICSAWASCHM
ncbi:MAG: transposase [Bacteroidales bacterium]|nr:transposase [Bacteroidales bacterium]